MISWPGWKLGVACSKKNRFAIIRSPKGAEEFRRILILFYVLDKRERGHPNVGILFDTFHANIEEKNIGAAYRTVARHLKHVHTGENDRGIPGSGHVEWKDVFQALRDIRYDGWLTIESFGFALGELSAAASIWRDIVPTPESITFEGVTFLKQNMASAAGR